MQFINKFKYKRKGHRIIKAFIKDKWNNDIQRYVNLNYNELKRIKAFKYLLLKEQQGFCCYCMRKIPFNEVTLEHVMPHHLEDKKRKEEVKYYSKFGRLKRGKIYYCPDKEIPISPKLHTPPYPHCIAHENLVASCQGKVFEGGEKYGIKEQVNTIANRYNKWLYLFLNILFATCYHNNVYISFHFHMGMDHFFRVSYLLQRLLPLSYLVQNQLFE